MWYFSWILGAGLAASFAILNEYRPIRQAAGHNSPFALRVLDSQNLFAAQAVTAV